MGQSTDAYARKAVTIASGAAVSESIALTGINLLGVGVLVPNAWTAANIGFEVSEDGTTWIPVYDKEGARITITGIATAAVGLYIAPSEAWVMGAFPHMRCVSLNTSTGANINQGAARSLKVIRLSS